MLDADHFKYYNDTFGHQVGDEVIKGIGRVLSSSVRKRDIVARYGGDEFIILLVETDYLSSIRTCMRIREKLKKELEMEKIISEITDIKDVVIPEEHRISLSIGVSKYVVGKSMDEIINEADTGLYYSKEAGRNCIHLLHNGIYKLITPNYDPKDFK